MGKRRRSSVPSPPRTVRRAAASSSAETRKRVAKSGQAARGKGKARRPDGWGATTRMPRSWLVPRITAGDLVPVDRRFAKGDKRRSREHVQGFAIVQVFKEASSNKPARIENDLWSLGTGTVEKFLRMAPTAAEARRVGRAGAVTVQGIVESRSKVGGRVVRVVAILAGKSAAEIARRDELRRSKRRPARLKEARSYVPVRGVKGSVGDAEWGAPRGVGNRARAAARSVRASRDEAQARGRAARPRARNRRV
jgi:hypothetical protein